VTQLDSLDIFDAGTADFIHRMYLIETTIRGRGGSAGPAAFSPDDTILLSLRTCNHAEFNTALEVWDVQTGGRIRVISGNWFGSFSFCSKGTQFVLGRKFDVGINKPTISPPAMDELLEIWDAVTGQLVRKLVGHTKDITSVAWSPDALLIVSSSKDQTLRLWDAATGASLHSVSTEAPQLAVAFSPRAPKIASIDRSGVIVIRDSGTLSESSTFCLEHRFLSPVASLCFSPIANWIVFANRSEFFLWDYEEGKLISSVSTRSLSFIRSYSISPDGSHLAVACGGVELWRLMEIATGALAQRSPYGRLSLSADATLVSVTGGFLDWGRDSYTEFWDSVTATRLFTAPLTVASWLVWSPDRKKITFSGDRKIYIYRSTGEHVATTKELSACNSVENLRFSPDGKMILLADSNGSAKPLPALLSLWDAETGDLLVEEGIPYETLRAPMTRFSADGTGIELLEQYPTNVVRRWRIYGSPPNPVTLKPTRGPFEIPPIPIPLRTHRYVKVNNTTCIVDRENRVVYQPPHSTTFSHSKQGDDYADPEAKIFILEDGVLLFLDFSEVESASDT
jgi:WD40 repeat protein